MIINRLLYLALLILSLIFYFASSIWFAWLLLVLVVALPLLSLLASLPAMLSCRLDAVMADTVEQHEHAALHLRLRSWPVLPIPDVQIRVNLRTRDQERDMRYLSRLSRAEGVLNLPTDCCGFLVPEFRKGRVYDVLGLFRLPMRLPKLPPMAILPSERPPVPMPQLDQFLQQQLKPKPGGGYSEQHDHRAYRPGDPVKDIHWKLSLKSDELVVREPLEPVHQQVVLAVRTPRGAESRAVNLGNFRYLSHWLLDHDVPHHAVWMEGKRVQLREIRSSEDTLFVLRAACIAPEDSDDLPWPLPLQANRVCHVGIGGTIGRKGGVPE